jgi:hypothetical protein
MSQCHHLYNVQIIIMSQILTARYEDISVLTPNRPLCWCLIQQISQKRADLNFHMPLSLLRLLHRIHLSQRYV